MDTRRMMAFVGLQFSQKTTSLELWGIFFSFGDQFGAMDITTAHELIHRREKGLQEIGLELPALD